MRKLINTVLAGALGLSMVAGASAQGTDTGDASIIIGINSEGSRSVEITDAPDFGVVPYSLEETLVNSTNAVDGDGVPTDTDLVIVATVDTGGEEGWNVTLTAGDFTTGGASAVTFDVTALSIGGGTNTTTANPGTGSVTLSPPADLSATTKVMSAPEEASSNGKYTSTFTGNALTVPPGTLVGEYTSTITVTIDAAP